MQPVPTFYLYGEPHRAADPGFVHLERLDHRSRPHGWTIRPHEHADLAQLLLIDSGGGTMQADAQAIAFDAPALLVVPPAVPHGFAWTAGSTGWVLTLAQTYVAALALRHPALAALFTAAGALPLGSARTEARAALDRLMRELGWSAPGSSAAAEGALLQVMALALRLAPPDAAARLRPGAASALVARFRARIEARFRLREPVAVHAAALGVSPSRLRAACAAIAATSPAALLDARALLEARRALLYTNLSVAEIGDALGFADPAYFSRFFRRGAGVSPRHFREGRR